MVEPIDGGVVRCTIMYEPDGGWISIVKVWFAPILRRCVPGSSDVEADLGHYTRLAYDCAIVPCR
jgi:hypothetical protein